MNEEGTISRPAAGCGGMIPPHLPLSKRECTPLLPAFYFTSGTCGRAPYFFFTGYRLQTTCNKVFSLTPILTPLVPGISRRRARFGTPHCALDPYHRTNMACALTSRDRSAHEKEYVDEVRAVEEVRKGRGRGEGDTGRCTGVGARECATQMRKREKVLFCWMRRTRRRRKRCVTARAVTRRAVHGAVLAGLLTVAGDGQYGTYR